jgi:hydrogenase maturation protease
MPPPPETLVIGYGNDLRGDDGAGVHAASLVAARSPRSLVIVTQQLTPDLAEDIAAAARVVFVDAYPAYGNGAPLCVERIRVGAAGPTRTLGHQGKPAELVHLADRLFGTSIEAWVVGIPAFSFDAGETISAETMLRIDEAAELIAGDMFAGN